MWARMRALEILVNDYLRTGLSGAEEDDMPTPAELWNHKLQDPHDDVPESAGNLLRFARIDAYKAWQKVVEVEADLAALSAKVDHLTEAHHQEPPDPPA